MPPIEVGLAMFHDEKAAELDVGCTKNKTDGSNSAGIKFVSKSLYEVKLCREGRWRFWSLGIVCR
jgi:hypothetical protein